MEALGLGLFMLSASLFGTAIEHPGSPLHHLLGGPIPRRAAMGMAMALTAIALVYSPWGRRSGAHLNPAVTWTFFRLGRIRGRDAAAYTAAQIAGGLAGTLLAALVLGKAFTDPPIRAVATLPGPAGVALAFVAELLISAFLMYLVLALGRWSRLSPYTGVFVGGLLFLYILVEAPLSGMSMNPARTLASALAGDQWRGLWIYFLAPPAGMLASAELHARRPPAGCAKLYHALPCVFCGGQAPANRNPRKRAA